MLAAPPNAPVRTPLGSVLRVVSAFAREMSPGGGAPRRSGGGPAPGRPTRLVRQTSSFVSTQVLCSPRAIVPEQPADALVSA